ncbi:MAG: Os1348 family NHLP clan protein [Anaerolineae bacterium]
MTANGLGRLIMRAVIDQRFQERLVAAPAQVMGDFDLTNDERDALTSIKAASFTEFAARLHRWLERRDPLHLGCWQDESSLEHQAEGFPEAFGGMDDFPMTASERQLPALLVWRPLCQEMSQAIRPYIAVRKEMNSPCPETYMASGT